MKIYDFELADFALSDKGVHLLRNKFNYRTIAYQELDKAIVRRAVEIKNVGLSFISGVVLVLFAFFQAINVGRRFNDPTVHTFYIEVIVLPVFPALVGGYLLYRCIKRELVLETLCGKEKHKLRLKDLVNNNQVNVLKEYLRKRLAYKFEVLGDI